MKRTWYKIIFGSIKKILIAFFAGLDNGFNHARCLLLSNQKYMIQPTLTNIYPNEYSQEFHYYSSAVKLDSWKLQYSKWFI